MKPKSKTSAQHNAPLTGAVQLPPAPNVTPPNVTPPSGSRKTIHVEDDVYDRLMAA